MVLMKIPTTYWNNVELYGYSGNHWVLIANLLILKSELLIKNQLTIVLLKLNNLNEV